MTDIKLLVDQAKALIDNNIVVENNISFVFSTAFTEQSVVGLDFISRFFSHIFSIYPNAKIMYFDDGLSSENTYLRAEYLMEKYNNFKYDIVSSDKSFKWIYTLYNRLSPTDKDAAITQWGYDSVYLPLKKYFYTNNILTVFFIDNIDNKEIIKNNPKVKDTSMEYSADFTMWKIYPFINWTDEDFEEYYNHFSIQKLSDSEIDDHYSN